MPGLRQDLRGGAGTYGSRCELLKQSLPFILKQSLQSVWGHMARCKEAQKLPRTRGPGIARSPPASASHADDNNDGASEEEVHNHQDPSKPACV